MAKLCPDPSSTVVSARRTVRPGIEIELLPFPSCTAPWLVNWLTSGRTCSTIRSPLVTVGTKARLMPYCLNSSEIVLFVFAIGIGNSPPTRKLAVSPLSAVRFGSAKVRISWSWFSASIAALMSVPNPPAPFVFAYRPVIAVAEVARSASPFAVASPTTPYRPRLPIACQLMPSSRVRVRDISMMRTRRLT